MPFVQPSNAKRAQVHLENAFRKLRKTNDHDIIKPRVEALQASNKQLGTAFFKTKFRGILWARQLRRTATKIDNRRLPGARDLELAANEIEEGLQ